MREYNRRYYAENRDAELARSRAYQASHESYAEYRRRYLAANREVRAAATRARRAADPEHEREIAARSRAANREARRAYHRAYVRQNLDRFRVLNHRRRARVAESEGSFTEAEWGAIVKRQRGKCATCGQKAKLEADHIIPIKPGGCSFAYNIQGLCKSCNSRKHANIPADAPLSLFDRVADTRRDRIGQPKAMRTVA